MSLNSREDLARTSYHKHEKYTSRKNSILLLCLQLSNDVYCPNSQGPCDWFLSISWKMSLYTCLIKSNLSFRILLMKNLYVVIFLHYFLWELDSEVQAVRCIFHRTGVPNPQAMDQYSGLLKTGPHSRGWAAC